MKSELYEIILDRHVLGMAEDIMTAQNVCSVMQGVITKELAKTKEKILSDHGHGHAQSAAFLLALDSFRSTEIAKFCLVLSMSRLTFSSQAAEALGINDKILLFDGAERMAQTLHTGLSKDTTEYIAKTLNVKGTLFKSVSSAFTQKGES